MKCYPHFFTVSFFIYSIYIKQFITSFYKELFTFSTQFSTSDFSFYFNILINFIQFFTSSVTGISQPSFLSFKIYIKIYPAVLYPFFYVFSLLQQLFTEIPPHFHRKRKVPSQYYAKIVSSHAQRAAFIQREQADSAACSLPFFYTFCQSAISRVA